MSDIGKAIDLLSFAIEERESAHEGKVLYEPIAPGDFFLSEYHCGMPRNMIPRWWLDEAVDFIEGGYNELIVTGSLGSYKTTWSNMILLYKIYELFSRKSIHTCLGLPMMQDIYNIYFSVSLTQSRLTGFRQFKAILDNSKFFKANFPRDQKINSIVQFPKNDKFSIFSGSGHQHAIGMTIWMFTLDEGDFFKKNGIGFDENYETVTRMYTELVDRRVSRFQKKEKDLSFSILISSASYQSSFVAKRIEEALRDSQEEGVKTKIIRAVKYSIMPEGFSDKKFLVFVGDAMIDPELVDGVKDLENVLLKLGVKHKIEKDKSLRKNYDLLPPAAKLRFEWVPMNLYDRYKKNLGTSLRNFSGIAIAGIEKLFQSKGLLLDAYKNTIGHPFSKQRVELSTGDLIELRDYFMPQILIDFNKPHALHIDGSLTGDATGMSMARYDGELRDGENYKRTYTQVFSIEIVPPPAPYRIKLSKIRGFIIFLREIGINIVRITFDQFQSEDSLQILTDAGFNVGRQSLDRTDDAYLTWMGLLMDGCVSHYYYEVLEKEAFAAIHYKRKRKVEHPKTGGININVLQSWVGALNNLMDSDVVGKQISDIYLPSKRLGKKGESKKILREMVKEGMFTDNVVNSLKTMKKQKSLLELIR